MLMQRRSKASGKGSNAYIFRVELSTPAIQQNIPVLAPMSTNVSVNFNNFKNSRSVGPSNPSMPSQYINEVLESLPSVSRSNVFPVGSSTLTDPTAGIFSRRLTGKRGAIG